MTTIQINTTPVELYIPETGAAWVHASSLLRAVGYSAPLTQSSTTSSRKARSYPLSETSIMAATLNISLSQRLSTSFLRAGTAAAWARLLRL